MKKVLEYQIETLESVYKTIDAGIYKVLIKSVINDLKNLLETIQ